MPRRPRALMTALVTCTAAGALAAQATPTNDAPNPYRTIENWAKLPDGRTWGSTSGVAIDRDGSSVWVAERCGANSCASSDLAPILEFDASGTLVRSFGQGMFVTPHGLFVDRNDNIWVTDCACTGAGRGGGRGRGADTASGRGGPPPASPPATTAPRGDLVYEFSSDGKLLLTLGTPGGAREPGYFFQPNAVLVAPNGDIYVSEGHSSAAGATARVLKFDAHGTFVASWGSKGNGPGQFDQPHALAMDSRGRLFVGDRANNRIQIFDQSGKLLDTWYQFSRPSGIYIDQHDSIYVADSESGSIARDRTDWKRGIRIGSVHDGKVIAFIPDPVETATNTSAAEGVAVDVHGVIYGAEVGPRALKRYIRN
ncbi:MAG TPA: peptidyl-alpha-hydroxyglycine alpha-amidating lyase family protein [Gemmatimonadales bacterium]